MKKSNLRNCDILSEISPSLLPYEKFEENGAQILTDAELLAVILRTGTKDSNVFETVKHLLNHPKMLQNGLPGLLKLSRAEMMSIPGIGKVKSAQLLCIIEVFNRIRHYRMKDKFVYNNPEKIAEYYMGKMMTFSKEEVIVVFLDTKLHKISEEVISIGTVNNSILDSREVFSLALVNQAVYIILLHNHPSGDPTPSEDDKSITFKLRTNGKMLNLPVIDHIIIGNNRYYSMKENGLL